MKTKVLLFFVLSSLLACGSKNSAEPTPSDSTPFSLNGLSGEYVNLCESEDGFSYQELISFQGAQMKMQNFIYFGEQCARPLLYGQYDRAFISFEVKDSSELPGYREYILKQESYTFTPTSVDAVSSFNKQVHFDYTDWQLNTPKDIAGRAFSKKGKPKRQNGSHLTYTIISQGNDLQFATYVNDKAAVSNDPSLKYSRR